jgi:hypothetical protein
MLERLFEMIDFKFRSTLIIGAVYEISGDRKTNFEWFSSIEDILCSKLSKGLCYLGRLEATYTSETLSFQSFMFIF